MFLIKSPSKQFLFTDIHGITREDVKNERSFDELWQNLNSIICDASYLVAHNAPFDKGVLNMCCREYDTSTPVVAFLCTVQLARSQWGIKPTKLNNVCDALNISLGHHEGTF